eukprot:CAMPEP_0179043202 /NCGR_PEP_ID=MMETSP0796-20121207/17047_1 /TAXON_ID=73915 /ORGANISM="Pyrodinium bahamense, Strain pbaha01" /LENGTH=82 /DNA_ID=CAMNT_0020739583 /DNA_START=44 /DNA_END=288 /DNA_ORIENTATION=+
MIWGLLAAGPLVPCASNGDQVEVAGCHPCDVPEAPRSTAAGSGQDGVQAPPQDCGVGGKSGDVSCPTGVSIPSGRKLGVAPA